MKKHAYLIMAHGQMDVLRKLIEELDYEWNDIYIHIDIKVGKISIKELTRNIKKSKIYFVKRMSVVWGGSSLIKCEMRLLKEAAKNEYRYFHYLSGVDFPIKTQKQIHEFFDLHDGKEFIEFWERDKADFEYRIKYYYPLQEKIGRYTFDLKTLIYRI